jgi:hypothetical protein
MRGRLAIAAAVVFVGIGPGGRAQGNPAAEVMAAATLVKYISSGSLAVPATLAGGALTLDHLSGAVAADEDGTAFVGVCASDFTHRVVVFDKDRHYVRDFEAGRCGTGEPVRIAVGPDHLLYATRIGPSDEIGVFDSSGSRLRLLAGIGRLETITARDIDLDAQGNVYVTIRHDTSTGGPDNDEVVRLSQSGQVTGRWQPLPPPYPCNGQCVRGVAPADDGTIWVTTTDPKRELVHLDAQGNALAGAPRLDVLMPGLAANQIQDVDFANGRLYIVGHVRALAVLSPDGKLIDSTCCEHTQGDLDRQVAVGAERLYMPGLPTSSAAKAPCGFCSVGQLEGKAVLFGEGGVEWSDDRCESNDYFKENCLTKCDGQVNEAKTARTFFIDVLGRTDSNCRLTISNWVYPKAPPEAGCPPGSEGAAGALYIGGNLVRSLPDEKTGFANEWILKPSEIQPGNVVVHWSCYTCPNMHCTYAGEWFEYKGEVQLHDPSGNVLDATSGRPVWSAEVLLEFSPTRTGRFGRPGLTGISPQVNPEVTSPKGHFAWDVAEGFWRMRVKAFGYRPFKSRVYQVPPDVTRLKFKLRRDPRQQRLLIDPSGRVGSVRLSARLSSGRHPGLRIRLRGPRVRSVVVLGKRFRTARGIRLGSTLTALFEQYPPPLGLVKAKRRSVTGYRLGRIFFSIRHNRVVGIKLGR